MPSFVLEASITYVSNEKYYNLQQTIVNFFVTFLHDHIQVSDSFRESC